MKAIDLREKSEDQLHSMLKDLSKEHFKLRMQQSTGQLTKTDLFKKNTKDIARIFTILSEKARK
jgi:large subunit ribosomal protein L29